MMKKRLLLSLFGVFVWFISFCSAEVVGIHWTSCQWWDFTTTYNWNTMCCVNYWNATSLVVSQITQWVSKTFYQWNWTSFSILWHDDLPLTNPYKDDWVFCIWPQSSFSSNVDIDLDFTYPEAPSLVPWWVSAFSWVVSGLVSSISEFIPYVSYIKPKI